MPTFYCFSWRTSWRSAWWTFWRISWRTSWRICCRTSWQISGRPPSWPSFFGDARSGYGSPARRRRQMTIVRMWGMKKGCSPSAADPSIQSPTSPSPDYEARPSSIPPSTCAAPPAAGIEARLRLPVITHKTCTSSTLVQGTGSAHGTCGRTFRCYNSRSPLFQESTGR